MHKRKSVKNLPEKKPPFDWTKMSVKLKQSTMVNDNFEIKYNQLHKTLQNSQQLFQLEAT